jgi:hypothetical protein
MRWFKRKYLRKKGANYWFQKICDYLTSDKCLVIFRKKVIDKKGDGGICVALYDPDAGPNGEDILWISANPDYRFLNSIIHELLHGVDDNLWEREVKWLTTRVLKRMSDVQYAHLLMILGENLARHYHFKKRD